MRGKNWHIPTWNWPGSIFIDKSAHVVCLRIRKHETGVLNINHCLCRESSSVEMTLHDNCKKARPLCNRWRPVDTGGRGSSTTVQIFWPKASGAQFLLVRMKHWTVGIILKRQTTYLPGSARCLSIQMLWCTQYVLKNYGQRAGRWVHHRMVQKNIIAKVRKGPRPHSLPPPPPPPNCRNQNLVTHKPDDVMAPGRNL